MTGLVTFSALTCREARARSNPSVPLIGIVPLGVIKGGQHIRDRAAGKGGVVVSYAEMKKLEAEQKITMPAELDRCVHDPWPRPQACLIFD